MLVTISGVNPSDVEAEMGKNTFFALVLRDLLIHSLSHRYLRYMAKIK